MHKLMMIAALIGRVLRVVERRLGFVPPLVARLCVGYVFVESGWGKLHNLDKVVAFFTDLGVPAPTLQAPFVAGVELFGGILLIAGLCTRLAAVPLSFTMVVAIATARRDELHGLSDLFGFIEALYIFLMAFLVVKGPGGLSVDHLLKMVFIGPESPAGTGTTAPARDRSPGKAA